MEERIEYIVSKHKVDEVFNDAFGGDTSFTEKPSTLERLFKGERRYSQHEVKDIWNNGLRLGIEVGLNNSSPRGQFIELNDSAKSENSKEFLYKFYKLAQEYNCAIEYHPIKGMVVLEK